MLTWIRTARQLSRALLRRPQSAERVQLHYHGRTIWMMAASDLERRYRVRPGAKEPWTIEWLDSYVRAGDVLYDIGANVGAFSLIGALHCQASVFAFEPTFPSYARLCENVHLNGCAGRIVPLSLALGDARALTPVRYRSLEPGQSRHIVGGPVAEESGYWQPTPMLPLDDAIEMFSLPVPQHIKLDVDGAETSVLRGAAVTLRRPELRSLLIEVEREAWEPVSGLLEAAGLQLAVRHGRPDKPGAPWYGVFVREKARAG